MRCALLMTHENVMDIAIFQGIVGRKDGAAWVSEHGRNTLLLQTLPENLCARFHHWIFHREWTRPSTSMDCRPIRISNRTGRLSPLALQAPITSNIILDNGAKRSVPNRVVDHFQIILPARHIEQ